MRAGLAWTSPCLARGSGPHEGRRPGFQLTLVTVAGPRRNHTGLRFFLGRMAADTCAGAYSVRVDGREQTIAAAAGRRVAHERYSNDHERVASPPLRPVARDARHPAAVHAGHPQAPALALARRAPLG